MRFMGHEALLLIQNILNLPNSFFIFIRNIIRNVKAMMIVSKFPRILFNIINNGWFNNCCYI